MVTALLGPPVPEEPLRSHPAKYPPGVLEAFKGLLGDEQLVVDPLGGVGKIGLLSQEGRATVSSDLEREWARQAPLHGATGMIADSTKLPYASSSVPAIAVSPAYANRLGDSYAPKDYGTPEERRSHATRNTYRLKLGRPLTVNSGAALQWGQGYRDLHTKMMEEWARVLSPGAPLLLNLKDHPRKGVVQLVTFWWWTTLQALGYRGPTHVVSIMAGGDQNTARARSKGQSWVNYETVARFLAPGT